MGFLKDGEGIVDQVIERRHMNITSCNPWSLSKGKIVHFWLAPRFGEAVKRGESKITHIMNDGTLVFEEGIPDTVKAGDLMLAQY